MSQQEVESLRRELEELRVQVNELLKEELATRAEVLKKIDAIRWMIESRGHTN